MLIWCRTGGQDTEALLVRALLGCAASQLEGHRNVPLILFILKKHVQLTERVLIPALATRPLEHKQDSSELMEQLPSGIVKESIVALALELGIPNGALSEVTMKKALRTSIATPKAAAYVNDLLHALRRFHGQQGVPEELLSYSV